jgi:hypothetical protein
VGNEECPSGNGQHYQTYGDDCYWNAGYYNIQHSYDPTSDLPDLLFYGKSNYLGSGVDQTQLCDGTYCYAGTTDDTYLDLYDHWTQSEFNILGYANGSTAEFNDDTSITVRIYELDQSGSTIDTSCSYDIGSVHTLEQNNLSDHDCDDSSYWWMTFIESN